jgi:cytochrome c biogenesis protein CcdA
VDFLLSGWWGGLYLVVLPCLPALIAFNVSDDLGNRRILTRLFLFPAGVLAVFVVSILAIVEFPVFFLTYASDLDVIWGALIVWLGYVVIRRKSTFVIRAARENFRAWCFGTFMMGMIFGSLWINYLSRYDFAVSVVYNSIFFSTGPATTITNATLYALGLGLSLAAAGLITLVAASWISDLLQHNRGKVKLITGGLIVLVGAYLISNDVYFILRNVGYL